MQPRVDARTVGLAALAWAGPAAAAPAGGATAWQALLSLVLVVVLILALGWLVRGRLSPLVAAGGGTLRIRAQIALGPRERVVVLRVGEEELLLGLSPAGLRTLHVLREPLPPEARLAPGAGRFAERLRAVLKGGGGST